jgi:hypothetical protein
VHGFDLCYERFNIHAYTMWRAAYDKMSDEQKIEFNSLRLSGRLKEIFNCEVVDLSWSGESNEYIANKTICYINDNIDNINPETTLVIAGWTEPQRLPFYLNNQKLNVCLSLVKNYIEVTEREIPQTAETFERVEQYKKFLGIQEIWNKNDSMSYTTYFRHTSLVFMLQQYLLSKNIRHCFFNSLRTWPLKPNYLSKIGSYESYDNLIDWSTWYPNKTITSYDWNWDEDISKNNLEKTTTYHPAIKAVNIFSKELARFIFKNY